ncbi:hypothetical protein Cs7R123_19010 [Catellatospora sp. TT07R-123]|nr:hypothetical protein Cs7R123_19010 [Catellatospora sp. TT07R-123]
MLGSVIEASWPGGRGPGGAPLAGIVAGREHGGVAGREVDLVDPERNGRGCWFAAVCPVFWGLRLCMWGKECVVPERLASTLAYLEDGFRRFVL